MAEITMVPGCYSKHAQPVRDQHEGEILPAEANDQDAEGRQMQGNKTCDRAKLVVMFFVNQFKTRDQSLKRRLPGKLLRSTRKWQSRISVPQLL